MKTAPVQQKKDTPMLGMKFLVPDHLQPETGAWWHQVMSEFELEGHHERLLSMACQAWDRAELARQVLQSDGLTFRDRFDQPKARPEVGIERDSVIAFARLIRELDLDIGQPAERSRPPALVSNRR
ncbi:hypothetical protein N9C56_10515 [Paracoccaceae bacterium]|nr:hypothetical protein [Paracoccaceae bacterium]